MRELLETLRNTKTYMIIRPTEYGMRVTFEKWVDNVPKKYGFSIGDVELGALEISLEEYIISKLEWFLEQLGIKTHA